MALDFFDSSAPAAPPDTTAKSSVSAATPLPDNFFDKPTKNLKQKQEKDKKKQEEEEWAQFQRAINEESHKSAAVVEHDDEEAKRQRELEEIEEQLVRWEKLHDLELKKEEVAKKLVSADEAMDVTVEKAAESDDEGDDFDLMNWRKRKLWWFKLYCGFFWCFLWFAAAFC